MALSVFVSLFGLALPTFAVNPPTQVTVVQLSSTSAKVSWANPAGTIQAIQIYQSRNGGSLELGENVPPDRTSAIRDSNIAEGADYCFAVRVQVGGTWSPLSQFACYAAVPEVSSVSAQATSDTRAVVTWSNPVGGFEALQLYASRDGGQFTLLKDLPGTARSADIANLQVGAQYCFKLRGMRLGRWSALSSASACTSQAPTAPSGVSVFQMGASQVRVAWNNPVGTIVASEVYASRKGGSYTFFSNRNSGEGFALLDLSEFGTAFCFKVRVKVGNIWSELSTTSACISLAPLPPSQIRVSALSSTSARIAWQNPPGVVQAAEILQSIEGQLFSIASVVGSNVQEATLGGLTYGKSSCFTVRVQVGGLWGPPSPDAVCIVLPPPRPGNLQAFLSSASSVSIRWSSIGSGEIESVEIQRSVSGGEYQPALITQSGAQPVQIQDLKFATSYCFRLRIMVAGVWSDFSEPACLDTPSNSGFHITKAMSPFTIDGEVTYTNLTIDPGVTLLFGANSALSVEGTLEARGTSGEPIQFQPASETAPWYGVRINNKSAGSEIAYCSFRRATDTALRVAGAPFALVKCTFDSNSGTSGAAIDARTDLRLDSCLFKKNTASGVISQGGAVRVDATNLVMVGCVIEGNSATARRTTNPQSNAAFGGGLWGNLLGMVQLEQCEFNANEVSGANAEGGGLWLEGGNITLNRLTVTGNHATGYGGSDDGGRNTAEGGGLVLVGPARITESNISDNKSHSQIGTKGGGGYFTDSVELVGSQVHNNEAGTRDGDSSGGGLFATNLRISGTIFTGNVSTAKEQPAKSGYGGAIFANSGELHIRNCVFGGNVAEGSAGQAGGAVYGGGNLSHIENCTFSTGNLPYVLSGFGGKIVNSIFVNGTNPFGGGNPPATYSYLPIPYPGEGNLAPSQVEPAFLPGTDFELPSDSPLVDAGDPSALYNDTSFPPSQGTDRNDIGAYGGPMASAWPKFVPMRPVIKVNGLISESLDLPSAEACIEVSAPQGSVGLRYRLDGQRPTPVSKPYTNQFCVTNSVVVRAYSRDSKGNGTYSQSRVLIRPLYALNVINPGGGSFSRRVVSYPEELSVPYTGSQDLYPSNTVVELVATPLPGWTFMDWQGSPTVTNPTNLVRVGQSQTNTLRFGTRVTAKVASGSAVLDVLPSGPLYPYGSTMRLHATPSDGFFFLDWNRDGVELGTEQFLELPVTETGSTYNAELGHVDEVPEGTFVLSIDSEKGGIVRRNPSFSAYNAGSTVELLAIPDEGFEFSHWEGDLAGVVPLATLNMVQNSHVIARFQTLSSTPPLILEQPNGVVTKVGRQLTLHSRASGSVPLRFQWWHDGVPVQDANTPDLILSRVSKQDSGDYFVTVSNNRASVKSDSARITVSTNLPPTVQIDTPLDFQHIVAPTTVPLVATVGDSDGRVVRVDFLGNGELIGSSSVPEADGSFKLNWSLKLPGQYTISARATDDDDATALTTVPLKFSATSLDPQPVFTLEAETDPSEVAEGAVFRVKVRKTGSGAGAVRVSLIDETAMLTAEDGTHDYYSLTDAESILVFNGGDSVKVVTIPTAQDLLDEGPETFRVQLSKVNATDKVELGSPNQISVTIIDDDFGSFFRNATNIIPTVSPIKPPGTVFIQLSPDEPGALWRFEWDSQWHHSKEVVDSIPDGEHRIVWRPILSKNVPALASVHVTSGRATNYFARYTAGPAMEGEIRLFLRPENGTFWRLAGESNSIPHSSGELVSVPVGSHVIEFFTDEDGTLTPPEATIVDVPLLGETRGTYNFGFVAGIDSNLAGTYPVQIDPAEDLAKGALKGYPFVGQVWTKFGWGTGFVVADRVILVPAHLVKGATDSDFLYWYSMRNGPKGLPLRPLRARGWCLNPAYAMTRGTQDQYEWDFAAVYFDESVSGGFSGGYLVSDPSTVNYLDVGTLHGSSLRFLGYPMRGRDFGAARLGNDHFLHAGFYEEEEGFFREDPLSIHTRTTQRLHGLGGNSGGPILVNSGESAPGQLPAAFYLGEYPDKAIVRLIDTNVVREILRAHTLATQGTNSCTGACTDTQVSGTSEIVRVRISIRPFGLLDSSTNVITISSKVGTKSIQSGDFVTPLSIGADYTISFPTILGYRTPDQIRFTAIAQNDIPLKLGEYLPEEALGLQAELGPDVITLIVLGQPGRRYVVEQALTLTSQWVPITALSTDGTGRANLQVGLGASNAFFRVRSP